MIPEPTVRPTAYLVSCLPPESLNYKAFSIEVVRRNGDRFAVLHNGRCLDSNGTWGYAPMPPRTDEWIATHRFDLETALRLAKEQAPLIEVNGYTIADVLAYETATP